MNLFIHAKSVPKNELPKLLDNLHNGQNFCYIIVADWKDIQFEWFPLEDDKRLISSEWGRAFGKCAEVRWRRDETGEKFICRWIFEGIKPPCEGESTLSVTDFDVREETFLLWGMPLFEDGKWATDSSGRYIWYVTRIPRLLIFPVAEEEQATRDPLGVVVRLYLREGHPIFDRFVRLERYRTPEEEEKIRG